MEVDWYLLLPDWIIAELIGVSEVSSQRNHSYHQPHPQQDLKAKRKLHEAVPLVSQHDIKDNTMHLHL